LFFSVDEPTAIIDTDDDEATDALLRRVRAPMFWTTLITGNKVAPLRARGPHPAVGRQGTNGSSGGAANGSPGAAAPSGGAR